MKKLKLFLIEMMFFFGVGSVAFGLWLFSPIAAFIWVGVVLMFGSIYLENKG